VSERNAVRTATVLVVGSSVALPALMHVPADLPSVAMGSVLLLYLERVLAVFVVLLFLLVFLYRGLWRGELPKAISERGAEWQDVLEETADHLEDHVFSLQARVESLEETVRELRR
jgi:hypothetical protein